MVDMKHTTEQGRNDSGETSIVTPQQLAKRFHTTTPTALSWFHKGWIPAVIAEGRVIRFRVSDVEKALAERANKNREAKQ